MRMGLIFFEKQFGKIKNNRSSLHSIRRMNIDTMQLNVTNGTVNLVAKLIKGPGRNCSRLRITARPLALSFARVIQQIVIEFETVHLSSLQRGSFVKEMNGPRNGFCFVANDFRSGRGGAAWMEGKNL